MHIPSSFAFQSLTLASLLLLATSIRPAAAADLAVDCSKPIGQIRALHGGNDGPIQNGELIDLSAYHREIGLPHTRLHDCGWPNPDVVDIHVLFPNPNADPSLPENYNFTRTDDCIDAVLKTGAQVVYRLGESIEHTKKKRYVHPPADYDRWAAVCQGIIRHYNEGWANGFRHNIRYWEIWNEPENRPTMWSGSDDDYIRLYEVTAKAIKSRWPDLKVGGPSLGYSGKITAGRFEPSDLLVRFLAHCRQRSLPLDFLSWHLYTDDPYECVIRARGIRRVLDQHGFTKTEMHLNEWNYLPSNDWGPMGLSGQGLPRDRFHEQMGGASAAAFVASVLMNLQDSPVDVANYYAANTNLFGLFNYHGTPRKTFYSFKAFKLLLDTPLRLPASGAQPVGLAICAGTNPSRSQIGVLISNLNSADGKIELSLNNLPWDGPVLCQTFIVDDAHNLVKTTEIRLDRQHPKLALDLRAPSVCLVKLTQPQEK